MSTEFHKRKGDAYLIPEQDIAQFNEQGYLVLPELLTEKEMQDLEYWFDHFASAKEAERMGRDFCDMSQAYGTPFEEFQLINAMLPSKYRPELLHNIFFKVAENISQQLYRSGKPELDYEQFLAKKPSKPGAKFAMHQDLGYWPKTTNTWTATFSLAITPSTLENGCLQVLPGSNREPELRKHLPKPYDLNEDSGSINRDQSHTLIIETQEDETVIFLPVERGSVTVHDERIVHGSSGNHSQGWRKTYVMAFRDSETIKKERAIGFTHSHNDKVNWDDLIV